MRIESHTTNILLACKARRPISIDCSAYVAHLDGWSQTHERQQAAEKYETFLGLDAAKLTGTLTPE